ncbi:MAG TPA: hypothetical protein VKB31_05945 [Trueperaceae bacterium]|nr:hypothetical protein [Trueperaceae bacterium]
MADEQTMKSIPRSAPTGGVGGEAAAATVGSAGAVVAIIGLAGVLPHLLAQIGVIVVGAALIAAQGTAVSRYGAGLSADERRQLGALPVSGGVTTEFVGGLTAALLGLLALLGVAGPSLLAIGVIILGAVEIASGRSIGRISQIMIEASDASPRVKTLARESAGGSLGAVLFIGMGGVALGILALVVTSASLPLVLVATLALGLGALLDAAARAEHASAAV